jgi:hypothetical protein
MLVKILSGNHAGEIVEQSQAEAESNIAFGFAELVPAAEAPPPTDPPPVEGEGGEGEPSHPIVEPPTEETRNRDAARKSKTRT